MKSLDQKKLHGSPSLTIGSSKADVCGRMGRTLGKKKKKKPEKKPGDQRKDFLTDHARKKRGEALPAPPTGDKEKKKIQDEVGRRCERGGNPDPRKRGRRPGFEQGDIAISY